MGTFDIAYKAKRDADFVRNRVLEANRHADFVRNRVLDIVLDRINSTHSKDITKARLRDIDNERVAYDIADFAYTTMIARQDAPEVDSGIFNEYFRAVLDKLLSFINKTNIEYIAHNYYTTPTGKRGPIGRLSPIRFESFMDLTPPKTLIVNKMVVMNDAASLQANTYYCVVLSEPRY